MLNSFFIYLINFVILGACLIKLLVYGDSVPKFQSKEAGMFYRHKRQADNFLKKVSLKGYYFRIFKATGTGLKIGDLNNFISKSQHYHPMSTYLPILKIYIEQ